ncbi:MAG: hypothetical protein GY936_15225 [Ignavibacteriae bacterium]|nr:hypothetical protein [Ignavibacteriota bacterium]
MIPIFLILSIFTHELGHALTAFFSGMREIYLSFYPGLRISIIFNSNDVFPEILFQQTNNLRDGFLASTGYNPPYFPYKLPVSVHNYIILMGSGFNYLISLLSILFLYLFKPKGILFLFGFMGALFFYDILLYSLLPTFFNLRHLFLWGGETAEPIVALTQLGIDQSYSISTVVVLSIIQIICLYKIIPIYNRGKS